MQPSHSARTDSERELIRERLARADRAPSLAPAQLERARRRFQIHITPTDDLSPRRTA